MGVKDKESFVLALHGLQQGHPREVFKQIGKVAGVINVTVFHAAGASEAGLAFGALAVFALPFALALALVFALALVLALATAAYSSCGDRLPLLGSVPALGHGHRFL